MASLMALEFAEIGTRTTRCEELVLAAKKSLTVSRTFLFSAFRAAFW